MMGVVAGLGGVVCVGGGCGAEEAELSGVAAVAFWKNDVILDVCPGLEGDPLSRVWKMAEGFLGVVGDAGVVNVDFSCTDKYAALRAAAASLFCSIYGLYHCALESRQISAVRGDTRAEMAKETEVRHLAVIRLHTR